jgi:TonB family protein
MKRENQSGSLIRISLKLLVPVVAGFIIVTAVYGKTISSESGTGKFTAVSQSDASPSRDTVLVYVSDMPVYHGGDSALLKFLAQNAKYPEEAKKNGITGKVIVRFIVEKDCSVSDVTVLSGVNPLLDAEAVRVASLLKFEKPGRNNGKPVAVWYMVPISFALK